MGDPSVHLKDCLLVAGAWLILSLASRKGNDPERRGSRAPSTDATADDTRPSLLALTVADPCFFSSPLAIGVNVVKCHDSKRKK